MRAELRGLQRSLATTALYVTHDQIEALTMGDRVAVLRDGKIEQFDTPARIYDRPTNTFVARFIGTPPMNVAPAALFGDGLEGFIGIRPEHLQVISGAKGKLTGRVVHQDELGHEVVVHVAVGDEVLLAALVARTGSRFTQPRRADLREMAPLPVHRRRECDPLRRASGGVLAAPYLVGLVILIAVPTVAAIGLAFTEFSGIEAPRWSGFDNIRRLFGDEGFLRALGNSLIYILIAVPVRLAVAVAFALLLERRSRGVGAARAIAFLPSVVPDVAYALLWLWLLNPLYGPLSLALGGLSPEFLTDPWSAR